MPLTEAGKTNGTSSSGSTAKTRSRPNSEYVLYSYGEPVGMTNDGGTSYFGTDILGSVRSVTDKYGAVQTSYDYDAFGSPYLGNLENDIGFGYCGKVYDIGTGLYDYGFRDYSPVSARFTTVDPVRDGSNWFSYVVNDPVNYVDPLGLTASDSSWWSNAKSTVKGWIDSAKSDLIQTWNDIKGVVSTTISDTKAAVSSFISNAQANLSKWGAQAKAEFTQLGNDIKETFFKTIVWTGVNLLGGDSTKNIYNDALTDSLNTDEETDIIKSTPENDTYGLSKGLRDEAGITKVIINGKEYSMIDTFAKELTAGQGKINKEYAAKTGESGLSDMGTVIGGHNVNIFTDINASNSDFVIVHIYATDTFNFEPGNGKRNPIGEALTTIGRAADLPVAKIHIYYDLKFGYKYNEEGKKVYYYAE